MKTEYLSGISPTLMGDIMLLLQGSASENATVQGMITKAKRNYVNNHHPRKISQIHSTNKYKDGKWRTYIYVGGVRKVVEADTEDDLINLLYDFYKSMDESIKTFEEVFRMLEERKKKTGRVEQTLNEDERHFHHVDEKIRSKLIRDITEDEIRDWIVLSFLPSKPKVEAFKKTLQLIKAVFNYGREKKLCDANPAEFINYTDYASQCDLETRSNEERSFSDEEIVLLREHALKNQSNPHAVTMLIAMETGMRVGELAALKKSDIVDGFLHVHSQQLLDNSSGSRRHVDIGHTKDQKQRPRGGRYVPITPACAQALQIAENLPGESEYILHNKDGNAILKDSYMQYLKRTCKRLGIPITHNHAFRVAFNARLISANIDGNDRCLILGHSMQTNERHYSFSDQRRLNRIRSKLSSEQPA